MLCQRWTWFVSGEMNQVPGDPKLGELPVVLTVEGFQSKGVCGWTTPKGTGMQLKSGNIPKSDEEIAIGASETRESIEVRNRLWERCREWWQWGSGLHLVFLLVLLVTPGVAGALWGPARGAVLGAAAAIFWLPFGCLSYRGTAGWYCYQGGLIGILLQIHHQLALVRQALPHPG